MMNASVIREPRLRVSGRRPLSCAAWTLAIAAVPTVLTLLGPAGSVRAEDKTLLIELDRRSDALPNAVNPTGMVVVGKLSDVGAFYWMPTTGVIDLGGGFATGVSADGNTIVGDFCDSFGFGQGWLHQFEEMGGVVARF
jgi:hypothetical protein